MAIAARADAPWMRLMRIINEKGEIESLLDQIDPTMIQLGRRAGEQHQEYGLRHAVRTIPALEKEGGAYGFTCCMLRVLSVV